MTREHGDDVEQVVRRRWRGQWGDLRAAGASGKDRQMQAQKDGYEFCVRALRAFEGIFP